MKTIKQVLTELRKAGFRLASSESTWAESKHWLYWPRKGNAHAALNAATQIRDTAGRPMVVEVQTEQADGFDGLFVSFPKGQRAAQMVQAGMDPTDLEHDLY